MTKPALPEIEIFRAGTHTAMDGTQITITPADLAAIASTYDAALGEAPLVVGHPDINAPAYGWVQSLRAEGDLLFAQPHQVDEPFAELVRKGRFKKRSASLFRPGSPGNPTPGGFYLRHVGFLGAVPPAISGLRDVNFAVDADAAVVEFAANNNWWALRVIADLFRRLRDDLVERDGAEKADTLLSSYSINSIAEAAAAPESAAFALPLPKPENPVQKPTDTTTTADFAARETDIAAREAAIAAREASIAAEELKTQRAGVVEFCAGLVKQGRLLPANQPAVVELLCHLDTQAEPLSFSAADGTPQKKPRADVLRELLTAAPVQIDFAERSAAAGDIGHTADFAAPSGALINRDRLELDARAVAYQRQHAGTSYLDAVRAVGG